MNKLIVVSLPKCGTNLIGSLLRGVGYTVTGEGIDNRFPSWCQRLDAHFITSFPENTCCCFHSLDLAALDGGLTCRWRELGSPKVIFNYRDPRAALLSMINYLVSGRYSGAGWQQIGADILQSLSENQRIDFGIDFFDEFLFRRYRDSSWLLKHPKVLCTTFERLVGPEGGGAQTEHANEISRVLAFANCEIKMDNRLVQMFDPTSRTYFKGQADLWRQSFGPLELARFRQRHGDILKTFGYPD